MRRTERTRVSGRKRERDREKRIALKKDIAVTLQNNCFKCWHKSKYNLHHIYNGTVQSL